MQAAQEFAFDGVVSPMIHPNTPRELAFPDGAIMPAEEMYLLDRTATTSAVICSSFMRVLHDYASNNQKVQGIVRVDDPSRYTNLFRIGGAVSAINRLGLLRNCEKKEDLPIHPLVVAAGFHSIYSTQMLGDKAYRKHVFKELQPALRHGETADDRIKANDQKELKKRYTWRYTRTLGLATASAALSVPALVGAHEARAENQSIITQLEAEYIDASPERSEEIASQLQKLEAENKGSGPLLLFLSGGALLRAGMWKLDKNTKMSKAKQRNNHLSHND
jgi:hypothetical protein